MCSCGRMFVSRTDELTHHRILARPMRMGFTARRYAGAVYAVVVCPSVCPSVCHKPVLYRNKWTNRAGFGMEASTLSCKEIRLSPKLKNSLWDLVPNSGLRKLRHNTSIALSTKLVDDGRVCWRHLYDNRRVVAVYYKSINCKAVFTADELNWAYLNWTALRELEFANNFVTLTRDQ